MDNRETELAAQKLSGVVADWLRDLGHLLQLVDDVLSKCQPKTEVSPEVAQTMALLRPMIRECRAQIPNDAMIQTWLQTAVARQNKPASDEK